MYQPLIKFHPYPAIITQVLRIFAVPKLPTNKFRIIERVNAHIFDGLFLCPKLSFCCF